MVRCVVLTVLYACMTGMPLFVVAEAKAMFVQLWSTLPTFGMEFVSCAELTSKRKGLVGVSKDKVWLAVDL